MGSSVRLVCTDREIGRPGENLLSVQCRPAAQKIDRHGDRRDPSHIDRRHHRLRYYRGLAPWLALGLHRFACVAGLEHCVHHRLPVGRQGRCGHPRGSPEKVVRCVHAGVVGQDAVVGVCLNPSATSRNLCVPGPDDEAGRRAGVRSIAERNGRFRLPSSGNLSPSGTRPVAYFHSRRQNPAANRVTLLIFLN